jgi:hypothetical protein
VNPGNGEKEKERAVARAVQEGTKQHPARREERQAGDVTQRPGEETPTKQAGGEGEKKSQPIKMIGDPGAVLRGRAREQKTKSQKADGRRQGVPEDGPPAPRGLGALRPVLEQLHQRVQGEQDQQGGHEQEGEDEKESGRRASRKEP